AQREIDQKIEMPDVALTQKFVSQHRAKSRRERHREFKRNVVVHQPLHHLQHRNVSFGDRLEEPVFLKKMLVLGMPDERQVRVKNEREMTSHCGTFTLSFRAERGISHWLMGHAG